MPKKIFAGIVLLVLLSIAMYNIASASQNESSGGG